jgi:PAS domain S-box-containing protein
MKHTPEEIAALQTELAALRTKVEQYELLLDNTNDLLGLFTPDGRYLYVNSAITRISGYTRDEYLQHNLYDYVHPDDIERMMRAEDEARKAALETTILTARVRRKDGVYIWSETSSRLLRGDDDHIKYLVAVTRDVTERVEHEQALLRLTAELERAQRLKDKFLAGMSHELRTPLTAILGLAEALQLGIGDGVLTETQQEMLATLEDSGRHLLDLINDVLDLSKIQAGRLTLHPKPMEIAACARSAWRMIQDLAHEKGVRLSLQIDDTLGWGVADTRRVKQILVNLLSNAVKFTPTGGTIGLEVHGDATAGVVQLSVWDTGVGIAPADLDKLFHPFVQIDARLAREHGGTGLGLSLVKQLAEMHGGSVDVESAVGRGSRFTVTLPWTPCPETDETLDAPASLLPPLDGAPRVLIVEDHPVLRALLTYFLQEQGYAVDAASGGLEALALAEATPPQFILMDVQMPGMDGLEVTCRLRALPACSDTPIIAVTALAMPGDRERCLDAGMTDYLSKPVTLPAIAAALHRAGAAAGVRV